MSFWTYIQGTVTVCPMGRTQPEKRYILETVLNHLPIVSGSEGDRNTYIIQKNGYSSSCSCDEFGESTNNLIDRYGYKSRSRGWLKTQDEYILVVSAALRDREFEQTYREFIKWLVRLAKRISCEDVLVSIKGYDKSTIIKGDEFMDLFEKPSWWNNTGEVNWTEFMMWNRAKGSSYPMTLAYKYFNDEENDKEVERRMNYR